MAAAAAEPPPSAEGLVAAPVGETAHSVDMTQLPRAATVRRGNQRGHLGPVLEDVFRDLYELPVSVEAKLASDVDEDAAMDGEATVPADIEAAVVAKEGDEELEVTAILSDIQEEQQRIHGFMEHLDERHREAAKQDQLHAEVMQENWGLAVGEHIPIPESTLRKLLDPSYLNKEGLVLPRSMMEEVERWIEIKKGTTPQHDNLLAVSKPEEPNHFKETASLKIRAQSRNIQPLLTDNQRAALADKLEGARRKRPPMRPGLNGDQRERNRKIVQSMQNKINFLKNPRFTADRGCAKQGKACPFWFTPDRIIFRDYQVGGVYEVAVEFRNVTQVGRRLRVLPCSSPSFSLGPMRYEGDASKVPPGVEPSSVIAPGMSAHVKVRFAPNQLNDETDEITIATEFGDYKLPVMARRCQPELHFQDPVDCGCILAGNVTHRTVRLTNRGGEGSFRLVQLEQVVDGGPCYYETREHDTKFVAQRFSITPASFYLDANQSIDITVTFSSAEVGRHRYPLHIECDNGQKSGLTLTAIADALRLELLRWPTLPRPLQPRTLEAQQSPWSLMPWQLSWLSPGVQVGCSTFQSIAISNGGNLPAKVEWRFVKPPPKLLTQLAVGNQQRLTDDIMSSIHTWQPYRRGNTEVSECPFSVSPSSATIPPFGSAQFVFEFHARAPVAHRATSFAYLIAHDVPASGCCFLHYSKLAQLEELDQAEGGYTRGLPLFGGAVSELFDRKAAPGAHDFGEGRKEDVAHEERAGTERYETASCAVTAVCLQGLSVAPSLTCMPRMLALAGSILPFISHTREIVLRNTGAQPAWFRVRLTSRAPPEGLTYEQLWVVAPREVGRRAGELEFPELGPPGTEYTVSLEKVDTTGLGVSTTHVGHSNEVLVEGISSGGMFAAWNHHNPKSQVHQGDQILAVNGACVTEAVGLHEAYKSLAVDDRLTVTLRRSRRGYLHLISDRLHGEWVPMPPQNDSSLPGFGAVATAAVEPDEGQIAPGETVKLRLTLRAPREADLNAHLFVDLPVGPGSTEDAAPPIKVGIAAAIRAPRVELRQASFLDYGVVRAHAQHTLKVRVDNPSDLPMVARLRQYKGEGEMEEFYDGGDFPMDSHQSIIDAFLHSIQKDSSANFNAVLEQDMPKAIVEPWVHSRSGCLDKSGRSKFKFDGRRKVKNEQDDDEPDGGLDDSVNFVFRPSCLLLWPRQSAEVDVTLRTSEVGKFRALLEAIGFDSSHTQCMEVFAEVQLPRLRLSTQHVHFPVTYVKTPTQPVELELRNDSDMQASFLWDVPLKLESGIEVLIDPQEGTVPPRGNVEITLAAVPTKVSQLAETNCKVFVNDVLQPLVLKASAKVYGLEVDYAVVPMGTLPPEIRHEPRGLTTSSGTQASDGAPLSFPVATGRAPKAAPMIDFGEMELQKSKSVQLVLYNRSGISTPWAVKVQKYPAYDPLLKGRKIGGMLDAATRMYAMCTKSDVTKGVNQTPGEQERMTFLSEPQPAVQGRDLSKEGDGSATTGAMTKAGDATRTPPTAVNARSSFNRSSKIEPKTKRSVSSIKRTGGKRKKFLLDDKHEKQAFRSNVGAEFAQMKEIKAQGTVALQYGRGWAVRLEPGNDWLQPFGKSIITLTCFSDLPGSMEDEVVLTVRDLAGHTDGKDFRIPIRLLSKGNPLFLPDQQVGLTTELDPPRLLCGTIVPAEKVVQRTFKVSNNSAAKMQISWNVYGRAQVNHRAEDRKYVNLALCGKTDSPDPFAGQSPTREEDLDDREGEEDEEEGEADQKYEHGEQEDDQLQQEEDSEGEVPFKFKMWTADPPQIRDPFALLVREELPLSVEPEEAVLNAHGSAVFTVSMKASKATATADGHYHYKLVGKGRFTEDREALLAAAAQEYESDGNTHAKRDLPSASEQVKHLPKLHIESLEADDSDVETPKAKPDITLTALKPARPEIGVSPSGRRTSIVPSRPLTEEPEQDVISTLVLDCVGDVIIPRLTVDKTDDPAIEDYPYLDPSEVDLDGTDSAKPLLCPVFKFMHSAVPHPEASRQEIGGPIHGGAPQGAQIPGIVSCLMRHITLTNRNSCNISCRFSIKGPFRIIEISQVGRFPVRLAEPSSKARKKSKIVAQQPCRQIFVVSKLETVTLQVEFVPDLVPIEEWDLTRIDHAFKGNLIVEYPREASAEDPDVPTDLQRVHLVAISRRPAVRVIVVPHAELDRPLSQGGESGPVIVDFGRVHVESSLTRRRVVLLLNMTNVLARWQLMHVARKKTSQDSVGGQDAKSHDDREAFIFDVCDGDLRGPSKDVLSLESDTRMPRWFPVTPALPHAKQQLDEHLFEPVKITIAFKPRRNEQYICRFRMQVDAGVSADIICRGHGSYNEQDDCMDFLEA